MAQNETKGHPELAKYDIPIRNRTLASLRMRTCVTPKVLSRNITVKNSPNSLLNSPIGSPLRSPSIGHENQQFYRQTPINADALEMLTKKVSDNKNTLKSLHNAETVYMLATGDIFMKPSDVLRPRASDLNEISSLNKSCTINDDFDSDDITKPSVSLSNILQDIAVTNATPRTKQLITSQISMLDLHTSDTMQYGQVRDYRIQSPRGNFSRSLSSSTGRDTDYTTYSNNLQQQMGTPPRYTFATKSGTKLPSQNKDQGYRRFKGSLRRPPSSYSNSRIQSANVFGKHQMTDSSDKLYVGRQNEFESSEENASYREKLNRTKLGSPILAVSKAIQQLGVTSKLASKTESFLNKNGAIEHSTGNNMHSNIVGSTVRQNRSPTNKLSTEKMFENEDAESASVFTQDEDDAYEEDLDGEVQEEVGCPDENDMDCADDTAISCLEDDNITEGEETELSESGRTSKSCGDNSESVEKEIVAKPAVITSIFSNCTPVINFGTKHEKVEPLPSHIKKLLKWKMSPITPIVVRSTVARSGFKPSKKNHDWIGYFGKHMKASGFRSLKEYQKINHFPGSFQVGRKDRLWRNLSRMQAKFGKKEFAFVPQSYVLPWDKKLLKSAWEEAGSKQKYIIKPPASARGIGIRLVHKWNQIPTRKPILVQKYLSKPLLLNGFKFDIRLYVYVTSFDPLRIYLFDDGLVRFATTKYSTSTKHLSNRYMHLTNYSINKNSGDFQQNDDVNICQGHKWSLKALWRFLQEENGVNTEKIWLQLKDIVVKTLISVEQFTNSLVKANCRRKSCCHELFGFDIMLDDKYHPWILEVNISPSLHSNSPLDVEIKGQLVSDMFNLAGFQIPDKKQMLVHAQGQPTTSSSSSSSFSQDKRKESLEVTCDTRAKHTYFAKHFKQLDEGELMNMMLDVLTVNDIQMLVETEDENSRRGHFQRIFPGGEETRKYVHFFEQPRYYNLLLHVWELKYQFQKQRGLLLLESFCRRGLHHISSSPTNSKTVPMEHVWNMSRLGKLFSSPRTDPKYLPIMVKSSSSSSSIGSASTLSFPVRISSAYKWDSSGGTKHSISSIEPKITSSRSTK